LGALLLRGGEGRRGEGRGGQGKGMDGRGGGKGHMSPPVFGESLRLWSFTASMLIF